MIHPDTRLVYINDVIGYGVFATAFIPKGTITYVKDALEIEVTPAEFSRHTPELQEVIEKYSYIDERGNRIISWDFGKYVNHCCHCNTMSTGYGFEIAIRDIQPEEEVTDEYGIFNLESPMSHRCNYSDCRGAVCKQDLERMLIEWDDTIKPALVLFNEVEQPLLSFLQKEVREAVLAPHSGSFPVPDSKAVEQAPALHQNAYSESRGYLPCRWPQQDAGCQSIRASQCTTERQWSQNHHPGHLSRRDEKRNPRHREKHERAGRRKGAVQQCRAGSLHHRHPPGVERFHEIRIWIRPLHRAKPDWQLQLEFYCFRRQEVNPVNQTGGRILHLGIVEESC
jgi:uncharacterized protein